MENLQSDKLARWQALFSDETIVGPAYLLRDRQWRVDLRSRSRANCFKTSSLARSFGILSQIEIPDQALAIIQAQDLFNQTGGDGNE